MDEQKVNGFFTEDEILAEQVKTQTPALDPERLEVLIRLVLHIRNVI